MKCTGISKNGQPCGSVALRGEDRCLFHSESDRARELRKKSHQCVGNVTRKELTRVLTKDFRAAADKDDEESRRVRLKIAPILHDLINEATQLSKLKRLAKERGLLR